MAKCPQTPSLAGAGHSCQADYAQVSCTYHLGEKSCWSSWRRSGKNLLKLGYGESEAVDQRRLGIAEELTVGSV